MQIWEKTTKKTQNGWGSRFSKKISLVKNTLHTASSHCSFFQWQKTFAVSNSWNLVNEKETWHLQLHGLIQTLPSLFSTSSLYCVQVPSKPCLVQLLSVHAIAILDFLGVVMRHLWHQHLRNHFQSKIIHQNKDKHLSFLVASSGPKHHTASNLLGLFQLPLSSPKIRALGSKPLKNDMFCGKFSPLTPPGEALHFASPVVWHP